MWTKYTLIKVAQVDKIYTMEGNLNGHIFHPLTKAQIQIIRFFFSQILCMDTFQLTQVSYKKPLIEKCFLVPARVIYKQSNQ